MSSLNTMAVYQLEDYSDHKGHLGWFIQNNDRVKLYLNAMYWQVFKSDKIYLLYVYCW